MRKIINAIKYCIGWPLSAIALLFIGKLLFDKTSHLVFHTINIPLLLLSLGCFIAFFFLRVLFWQKLLATKGLKYSFKETAYTWGFSEVRRYIPGGVWSILSRSNAYSKSTEQKAILSYLFQETAFVAIACITLSLLSFNFIVFGIGNIHYDSFLSVLGILIICTVVSSYLFHKKIFPKKAGLFKHLFPDLPISQMLLLFFCMTCGFLLFGLATFFAIDSVVSLFFPHILSLSGFFVFTFLAGYLSFFAPMGLGVREGLITIGLARYVPVADAALSAIFSRVVQIVAELIFLGICLTWIKIPKEKIQKLEAFILRKKYELGLFLSIVSYVSYFSLASFLRYANFFTGRFDLGNMDQTVWNTIHGRIFQLTNPDGTNIMTRLAFHADFMLVLLAPFYWVWQDPRMLLFLQSLAIGVGAFFVYAIANSVLQKKSLSLAFVISYLLYPTLQYANLFDFHPVTIAVPFLLGAWYLMIKNKYWWSTLFLLIAATSKEEVWVVVGLFGILFLFQKKKLFLGSLLSIISFGLFYYLFFKAIPTAHGGDHFALSYYSDFGSTPGGVIKNIFLSPLKTISVVFGKGQLFYLLALFGPVALLSFIAFPILVFATPDLGISLLSQNAQLHSIYYHYAAIPTPFIFIAAIYGLSSLHKKLPRIKQYSIYLILIPAVIFAYLIGPLPGAYHASTDMFTEQLSYAPLIDSFLDSIPKRYSVAATNNVGSHLSHRQKIFTIPTGLKDADIVVFLLDDSFAQPSLNQQKEMAKQLDKDPAYVKLFSYKDFVVYKKKSVPTYFRIRRQGILPLFRGN